MSTNKNKIIVIYKSKYGSTKRYAQWIAEEVGADIFPLNQIKLRDLEKYDTIVYGGAVYAVGMLGISALRNSFSKLAGKKVVVFSVGASPAYPEAMASIQANNFSDAMKENVHFFHLRGGFDYTKLNWLDRTLMMLLKLKIQRKSEDLRTGDEKGMLAACQTPADWTKKEAIKPIVECIVGDKAPQ